MTPSSLKVVLVVFLVVLLVVVDFGVAEGLLDVVLGLDGQLVVGVGGGGLHAATSDDLNLTGGLLNLGLSASLPSVFPLSLEGDVLLSASKGTAFRYTLTKFQIVLTTSLVALVVNFMDISTLASARSGSSALWPRRAIRRTQS